MDRIRFGKYWNGGLVVLASLCVLQLAPAANGQRSPRKVYNPVTGQTEVEQRGTPRRAVQRTTRPASQATPVRQAVAVDVPESGPVGEQLAGCNLPVCDGACGDPACCDIGCNDVICGEPIGCGGVVGCNPRRMYAGFEFTFVKPRFENNVAFTLTESDGAGNDTISDAEFDHDLELTPRVYVGWKNTNGVGLRATWWQFDHESSPAAGTHPDNGFGNITHPAFGTVNIGTTQLNEQFQAGSTLNAYTIDIEATKETSFCGWDLGVAGGVRYASAEQGYDAQLRSGADVLLGQIDYHQSIEGIGPTISLSASRQLTRRTALFTRARGSVLFGDGESHLQAGEDLDLTTSFSTTRIASRDDLLSIAEIQLGFKWQGDRLAHRVFTPFVAVAMEGQVWNGAGNATSEEGNLGFFGFTTNVGIDW